MFSSCRWYITRQGFAGGSPKGGLGTYHQMRRVLDVRQIETGGVDGQE